MKPLRIVVAILGVARAGYAQSTDQAMPSLLLNTSAAGLALAGVSAATDGRSTAVFVNPALAFGVAATTAEVSVQRYLAGSTLSALSFSRRARGATFALGAHMLDYGSSPEIVADPLSGGERGIETGGSVSASEMVLTAGLAGSPSKRIRFGAGVEMLRQELTGDASSQIAWSFGTAVAVARYRLTGGVQHLGAAMKISGRDASLPALGRVGVTRAFAVHDDWNVETTAEVTSLFRGGSIRQFAAEARYAHADRPTLIARMGWRAPTWEDVASPLSFGAGFARGTLSLDYGFQGLSGIGGATHRFGIRWAR